MFIKSLEKRKKEDYDSLYTDILFGGSHSMFLLLYNNSNGSISIIFIWTSKETKHGKKERVKELIIKTAKQPFFLS